MIRVTAVAGASAPVLPGPDIAAPRGPRSSTNKVVVPLLVMTSACLAWLGWYAMFTSTEYFDDEGDWLIGLKQFHQHGHLYHSVWSQCGPFYYDFWSLVFTLFRAPIDVDSGRVAGLATWIAICFLSAVLVWRSTHRLSLALLVQVAVFFVMEPLSGEPMEPAGLATLLVVGTLLCAVHVRARRPRLGMALVGALVAATILTKVNIGAFLLVGAVVAVLVSGPSRRWFRLRWLAAAGLALGTPVILCLSVLSRAWVRSYVELVVLSMAALLIGSAGAREAGRDPESATGVGGDELAWSVVAAASVAGTAAFVGVLTGTGLWEMVRGALLAQRSLPSVFSSPFRADPHVLLVALLSVSVAVAVSQPSLRNRLGPRVRVGGRAAAGALIVVTGIGGVVVSARWPAFIDAGMISALFQLKPTSPSSLALGSFQYAVSLAWIALRRPTVAGGVTVSFERSVIVAVAVLLTLEGFPVDGHQVSWSVVGLLVVGVLILADAFTLADALALSDRRLRLRTRDKAPFAVPLDGATDCQGLSSPTAHVGSSRVLRTAVVSVMTVLLGSNLAAFVANYRSLYADNRATSLTGALFVRWPATVVADDESVTRVLSTRCTTFYGLPGLNSFYFFTGEEPPTSLLTTQWMYLMDGPTQRRVVAALRRVPRLCVLYYDPALAFWEQGKDLPTDSPILRYMETGFAPIADIDGYVVLDRSTSGSTPPAGPQGVLPEFRSPISPQPVMVPWPYS